MDDVELHDCPTSARETNGGLDLRRDLVDLSSSGVRMDMKSKNPKATAKQWSKKKISIPKELGQ